MFYFATLTNVILSIVMCCLIYTALFIGSESHKSSYRMTVFTIHICLVLVSFPPFYFYVCGPQFKSCFKRVNNTKFILFKFLHCSHNFLKTLLTAYKKSLIFFVSRNYLTSSLKLCIQIIL